MNLRNTEDEANGDANVGMESVVSSQLGLQHHTLS